MAIPIRRYAGEQPEQNEMRNEAWRNQRRPDDPGDQQNQQPESGKSWGFYTYIVAAVAALGGLLFGYDTGVISGAELFLVKDFKLTSTSEEIAVSAVLIGAIIGAIFGGKMADWLGRRLSLIILGIIFGIGAILTAIVPNLPLFIVFRILVGIGIGAASLIAPMYIAEMAPPAVRGKLVAFNQLAVTVGIAVAFWVDLAFAAAGASWRPMFAVAVFPAAALAIGMFFLADTPRWLASKGRWDDAEHALSRIAGPEAPNELE
ncbi:MAG: MFS transporter, partial [Ktedonobacterales bacterium]